jgi:HK97 family phage major capsid protein
MSKVTEIEGDTGANVDASRSHNEEITEKTKDVERLVDAIRAQEESERRKERDDDEATIRHPGGKGGAKEQPQTKTLGELFVESRQYTEAKDKSNIQIDLPDVEMKTLMTTSAGWAPETTRGPRLVDYVTRPVQVTDTIPSTTTNQVAIKYMEETTFTNAAAEVAEGGTKPEAALALTERSDPVQKIAVWIPVTDEQLEDVSQVQGYITNRLTFMVRQRLDTQILVGNGTSPNLSGLLDRSGIQTQDGTGDPIPDAMYKAMTKVRLTGAGNGGGIANVMYMNPLDWQEVRLLKTVDGVYIWGAPSDIGPARMWGLTVVEAEGLTQGTGIVADSTYLELAVKKGVTLKSTDSHSDYFIKNQQVILAEMRVALVVYRPAVIVQVTNLGA